jgi:hypothetical protein
MCHRLIGGHEELGLYQIPIKVILLLNNIKPLTEKPPSTLISNFIPNTIREGKFMVMSHILLLDLNFKARYHQTPTSIEFE